MRPSNIPWICRILTILLFQSLCVDFNTPIAIMSPKDSVANLPSLESDSTNVQPVVYQKFGEMELPEDEEDGDYSPSESDSDDSLEWASETERTIAEDELAEGKVGLDFFGAAVSVATEYLASYKPVQLGLGVATTLPVSSVQRAARAARRAGMKGSEGSIRRLASNSYFKSIHLYSFQFTFCCS